MDCLGKDGLDHPFLCPGMDGIAQRVRKAVRLCPGMDGIAQRVRKAVRLCPWMDGLKIAPAFSALPTSMWVVSAKSQEGGAVMSMDGRYSAKSQEGGAVLFSNLVTEKCRLKMAHYCHAGFVYA